MSQSHGTLKGWTWLRLASLVILTTLSASAMDVRFSQTLSAADRTASGLDHLSSDQVAVLDALARRDLTARNSTSATPPAARFSQRLSADEQRNAGITVLKPEEVARLDEFLDRHAAGLLARSLLGPPVFISPSERLRPIEPKDKERGEIHGSFSLSYGWGKGGSEKTGSMMLNYQDPAGRYSIGFEYTESHIKGAGLYRDYQDELLERRMPGNVLFEQP